LLLANLPTIKAKELITLLLSIGFEVVRINGSHHRLRHPDGRVTTVPVHAGREIPKGILRKIIREDLKMEVEEFVAMIQ
jgi:predicted RNA binding protein YcfA (HicA-like mRNA interferase family)